MYEVPFARRILEHHFQFVDCNSFSASHVFIIKFFLFYFQSIHKIQEHLVYVGQLYAAYRKLRCKIWLWNKLAVAESFILSIKLRVWKMIKIRMHEFCEKFTFEKKKLYIIISNHGNFKGISLECAFWRLHMNSTMWRGQNSDRFLLNLFIFWSNIFLSTNSFIGKL